MPRRRSSPSPAPRNPPTFGPRAVGWSIFVGYAALNVIRKAWPSAIAQSSFTEELGLTPADIGAVTSFHGAAYGLSKFFSAVLMDRVSPEHAPRVFSLGLCFCGAAVGLMASSTTLESLTGLWILQGLLQGLGWPTASKLLVQRMEKNELGYWWGLISVSGNVGAGIAPTATALLARHTGGWRVIFVASGTLALGLGVGVHAVLSAATPSPLSLRAEGHGSSKRAAAGNKKQSQPAAAAATPSTDGSSAAMRVLCSPPIWLLALSNMAAYLPLKACGEWGVLLSTEQFGTTVFAGSMLLTAFEGAGFFGTMRIFNHA